MTFTLHYEDNSELEKKLRIVAGRIGFILTPAQPERITVGELARRTKRNLSTISTALRRDSCPPFVYGRGNRKILWLEPNDQLLSYLTNSYPGQRNDKPKNQK